MHGKFLALLLVFSLALVVDACNCFKDNIGYAYLDLNNGAKTIGPPECQELCQKTTGCKYFTWNKSNSGCWLKDGKERFRVHPGIISGPVRCACFEDNVDYYSKSFPGNMTIDPLECQELCEKIPSCKYFTWNKSNSLCWLKQEKDPHPNPNGISGPVRCDVGYDCFEEQIGYGYTYLNNGNGIKTPSTFACQDLCQKTQGCKYFTWRKSDSFDSFCWLMTGKVYYPDVNAISGPVTC